MILYDIFPKYNLLIIKFEGILTEKLLSDFVSFMTREMQKYPVTRALDDLRNATFAFTENGLQNIINIRALVSDNYLLFKELILISQVQQATFSLQFKSLLKQKKLDISICSTLDYAIEFFGLPISEKEIEEYIQNLSLTFNPH